MFLDYKSERVSYLIRMFGGIAFLDICYEDYDPTSLLKGMQIVSWIIKLQTLEEADLDCGYS